MNKAIILGIVALCFLPLSVYGEIIVYGGTIVKIAEMQSRIFYEDGTNFYQDINMDFIKVTASGGVYWSTISMPSPGNGYYKIYYFNGNENIELCTGDQFITKSCAVKQEGNYLVQRKDAIQGPNTATYSLYIFDGTTNKKIIENVITDRQFGVNNGFVAFTSGNDPSTGYVSLYLYKPDQPTAVNMSAIKATPANKAVKLTWQTETESDNVGFNVWRAEGFQKVNEALIPAEGSPIMGADYDFFDRWVMNGNLYYYIVEDVNNNGISTFHGPVKATPRWIYGAESR